MSVRKKIVRKAVITPIKVVTNDKEYLTDAEVNQVRSVREDLGEALFAWISLDKYKDRVTVLKHGFAWGWIEVTKEQLKALNK